MRGLNIQNKQKPVQGLASHPRKQKQASHALKTGSSSYANILSQNLPKTELSFCHRSIRKWISILTERLFLKLNVCLSFISI